MEKLTKYKDLETEIKKTWEMKTPTIPVIIGTFGLVKKGIENYVSKIPGNIRITENNRATRPSSLELLAYLGGPYPSRNPADL